MSQPVAPETVLVVIDKAIVLADVSSILKNDGFTVLSASTPEEAIRISLHFAGTIDLLLTEAMMPGMSGPDLARELITQRTKLRVLMMTGYANGQVLILNHGWHLVKIPSVAGALREAISATLHCPDGQPPDEFDTRTHFPNGEEIPKDKTRPAQQFTTEEVQDMRLELEQLRERLAGLTVDVGQLWKGSTS
jgi:CheY-like chemotaxis protein